MVALVFGATISCTRDTLQKVSSNEIIEKPTEETKNLQIMYTVDGGLKNKIVAETAIKLQNGDSVIYICPNGLYIVSYKNDIAETSLRADSATYKETLGSFTAIGNVVARNLVNNKRLETKGPLYWDSKKKTIDTFVFSTIYSATDTIYAKEGLSSDDEFKNIELRKQSGVVTK